MNTQKFKNNGRNKFPLSTDTLDFIQEQIKLVYGLTSLAGTNIILKESSSTAPGLVIVNGELMPLTGTPAARIAVETTSEDVTFLSETIENARITKVAVYSSYSGTLVSNFSKVMTIEESQKHHVPKGTVIDWYGEASCDNLPFGWVPCGGFFPNNTSEVDAELAKWQSRYNRMNIAKQKQYNGYTYYAKITSVNGVNVPDLTGRFIVGAGTNSSMDTSYAKGSTGGSNKVTLTAAQSGLPAHSHTASGSVTAAKQMAEHGYWIGATADNSRIVGDAALGVTVTVNSTSAQSASSPHENRPPYFALYKLIKVI